MFKDVNLNANNNISVDDTRIKSSKSNSPSFRATNPNAVDTTPTADTYSPASTQQQPEMSMGEKYIKYGIPTGAALYLGSELFDKANEGPYEKSLVGRLGKFGDKISNTAIIRNRFVEKLNNSAGNTGRKIKDYIMRHPKLRAMYETPTAPEHAMVTNFLETQAEDDLKKGVEGLKKNFIDKNPKTLKLAGATAEEIEALKASYGTGLFGRIKNESAAVEEFLLKKIGSDLGKGNIVETISRREAAADLQIEKLALKLNDPALSNEAKAKLGQRIAKLSELRQTYRARTLRSLKLEALGMTKHSLTAVQKAPVKNMGTIKNALESAKKYCPKLSEHFNKINSITAPATKLGRFLPKAAKLGMRGLTFGGGLFNCLFFLGFFLGDAVKNTIDAPKDKKVATGVHGLFDAMSWVIAMPIALKGMHAVNGLKNLGKSKEQVDAYKSALKTFNANVKAGKYADKAVYDAAYTNLMSLKNVGTPQKGLNKVLSKIAGFLSTGLEMPKPYRAAAAPNASFMGKAANFAKNLKFKLPNFAKNCLGNPLRFALYMFAFQPIVDKIFTTPIKAMFGEPYDPEKIKEEAEKEAAKRAELYPGPRFLPLPEAEKGLDNLDPNSLPDDNLIKQELIKKGLVKPNGTSSRVAHKSNGNPNSVNGVSINTTNSNTPYMPPESSVNGYPGYAPNNTQGNDPNKSDYDNVNRTYVPNLDLNSPLPYHDPMTYPDNDRNYDAAQKSMDKTTKIIKETEEFINNKHNN